MPFTRVQVLEEGQETGVVGLIRKDDSPLHAAIDDMLEGPRVRNA